ncbi:maleylpyruvate isomerase family mycothiol-dependent enzyme [Streptomyces sp. NPDC059909]|uniref:maleylpyruvate isomerase family mycothiol-dependent enzyme n=1 Tax=Streptomyces sp. NPDC059909 TaxID=3346998 RepID=UPI003647D776
MSDALLNALAEALADVVTVVETCDDDVLDPDTAVKWLETTAYVLDRLPPSDRLALGRLFRAAALRQPEPWRDDLLRLPEGFGLDEDQHELYCAAIDDHVRRFAETVRDADPATPVPTCPGWDIAELVKHHGTTHRWIGHVVGIRATERVWSRDVPLGLPDDPAAYPEWLARSAADTLATLRATDPDAPMWSHGADQHVRFFPRRLLFEAVIHLADVELALGRTPRIGPATAADGIEEFLENLPYFSWIAEPVAALTAPHQDGSAPGSGVRVREGASLRLKATDTGATWTISLQDQGAGWTTTARGEATATVEAASGDLLLLVYGRYAPADTRFTHSGDRRVLDAWLSATAL